MEAEASDTLNAITKLVVAFGAAAVLTAAATVIIVLVWHKAFRRLRITAGKGGAALEVDAIDISRQLTEVAQVVDEVKAETKAINRAVNHQPDEAPTLVVRVGFLEESHAWLVDALGCVAAQLGLHLPDPPRRKEPTT